MPPVGRELDELLSGYIDGQLDDRELRVVEGTLESPDVQKRLAELRQVGDELRLLHSTFTAPGLPADFAERVLAASRVEPVAKKKGWQRSVFVAAAALAASFLLAIYLPSLLAPPTPGNEDALAVDSTTPPNPFGTQAPAANDDVQGPDAVAGQHYVGDDDFKITYMLVLDLGATAEAIDQQIVEKTLALNGIVVNAPALGGADFEKAMQAVRMNVQPIESPSESLVYFVNANLQSLDSALQALRQDTLHFPDYRFDLAFDSPLNRVGEVIAKSTGKQFAVNQPFAVPAGAQLNTTAPQRAMPVRGIPLQGRLVSSARRLEPSPPPMGLGNSTEEYGVALLIVRMPKR